MRKLFLWPIFGPYLNGVMHGQENPSKLNVLKMKNWKPIHLHSLSLFELCVSPSLCLSVHIHLHPHPLVCVHLSVYIFALIEVWEGRRLAADKEKKIEGSWNSKMVSVIDNFTNLLAFGISLMMGIICECACW